jgi:hypothetical protein
MHILHYTSTDYRRLVTWQDEDGTVLEPTTARLQAVDGDGLVVLDLSYYADAPSESTIAALPGLERGYLSPNADGALEIHISDQNTVEEGRYRYDLMAQEPGGDWSVLVAGGLRVVEVNTDPSS